MTEHEDINTWWLRLTERAEDRELSIDTRYQALENAGLINRVVVHRFMCPRGCVVGTVIRVGGQIITRTRDYKLSPGLNESRSVEAARKNNTLDGERHWPGHTFDVVSMGKWGPDAGMDMCCRHIVRTVRAADILTTVDGVQPGRPSKPTRFTGGSNI